MGHSIVTFDEASFRLVPVYRRVWFIKGEKPRGIFFWSNKKIIIFAALIDGKKFHYEFYDSMNSLTYKAFLSDFVEKLPKRKNYIFLFDNAPYHKSSTMKKFFEEINKDIKVEFFPPYCPELNPTETCWKTIRQNVTNSTYFSTTEEMAEEISKFADNHFFMLKVSNYLCR